MIVFDLRCSGGHVFEAWFGSSAAFADQSAGGLLVCPICGDLEIEKAPMSPNVSAKGNRRSDVRPAAPTVSDVPSPEMVKAVLAKVAEAQAASLEHSTWVGSDFAKRARAMHAGDESAALIHGQATREQARDLIDDGVAVAPLLVPVVPPEVRN